MLDVAVTVVAAALALSQPLPQILQLARSRSIAGVSAATTWIGVAVNAAWVAYGLGRGHPPIIVVSVLYLIGYLAIAGLLVAGGNRRGVPTALAATAAFVAIGATAGWTAVGTVLGLVVGVQFIPQIVEAWSGADLAGLAPGTYRISLADGIIWGGFGLIVADGPLVLYGVLMATAAVAVLIPQRRWARQLRPA